jgi:8-oxo-dGTP pyrophosphatase MutT (NUDIX family)
MKSLPFDDFETRLCRHIIKNQPWDDYKNSFIDGLRFISNEYVVEITLPAKPYVTDEIGKLNDYLDVNYLLGQEKLSFLPKTAVVSVIKDDSGRVGVLERREQRRLLGGWKTIGVYGKVESSFKLYRGCKKVSYGPEDHVQALLREVQEELDITTKIINHVDKIGQIYDFTLGWLLDVYELEIDGSVNKKKISQKELVDFEFVEERNLAEEKELVPSSVLIVEKIFGEGENPYIKFDIEKPPLHQTGSFFSAVFYPKMLLHARPGIIDELGEKEMAEQTYIELVEALLCGDEV